jgi:hypothetical protein
MKALTFAIVLFFLTATSSTDPKPKRECDPEHDLGRTDGRYQYECSPEGKWVENVVLSTALAKVEEHKAQLAWALRSRVLTDEEMGEVATQGSWLLIPDGVSFYQADVDRQFNEALLQQFRLRAIAKNPCKQ